MLEVRFGTYSILAPQIAEQKAFANSSPQLCQPLGARLVAGPTAEVRPVAAMDVDHDHVTEPAASPGDVFDAVLRGAEGIDECKSEEESAAELERVVHVAAAAERAHLEARRAAADAMQLADRKAAEALAAADEKAAAQEVADEAIANELHDPEAQGTGSEAAKPPAAPAPEPQDAEATAAAAAAQRNFQEDVQVWAALNAESCLRETAYTSLQAAGVNMRAAEARIQAGGQKYFRTLEAAVCDAEAAAHKVAAAEREAAAAAAKAAGGGGAPTPALAVDSADWACFEAVPYPCDLAVAGAKNAQWNILLGKATGARKDAAKGRFATEARMDLALALLSTSAGAQDTAAEGASAAGEPSLQAACRHGFIMGGEEYPNALAADGYFRVAPEYAEAVLSKSQKSRVAHLAVGGRVIAAVITHRVNPYQPVKLLVRAAGPGVDSLTATAVYAALHEVLQREKPSQPLPLGSVTVSPESSITWCSESAASARALGLQCKLYSTMTGLLSQGPLAGSAAARSDRKAFIVMLRHCDSVKMPASVGLLASTGAANVVLRISGGGLNSCCRCNMRGHQETSCPAGTELAPPAVCVRDLSKDVSERPPPKPTGGGKSTGGSGAKGKAPRDTASKGKGRRGKGATKNRQPTPGQGRATTSRPGAPAAGAKAPQAPPRGDAQPPRGNAWRNGLPSPPHRGATAAPRPVDAEQWETPGKNGPRPAALLKAQQREKAKQAAAAAAALAEAAAAAAQSKQASSAASSKGVHQQQRRGANANDPGASTVAGPAAASSATDTDVEMRDAQQRETEVGGKRIRSERTPSAPDPDLAAALPQQPPKRVSGMAVATNLQVGGGAGANSGGGASNASATTPPSC